MADRTNLSRRLDAAITDRLPVGIRKDLLDEVDKLTRDRDTLLAALKYYLDEAISAHVADFVSYEKAAKFSTMAEDAVMQAESTQPEVKHG